SGTVNIVLPAPRRHGLAGLFLLDRFFHVLARTERAPGAGQDRHLEGATVAKLDPDRRELRAEVLAERVKTIRPVHAHHHNPVATLDLDKAHSFSFFAVGRSTQTAPSALIAAVSALV